MIDNVLLVLIVHGRRPHEVALDLMETQQPSVQFQPKLFRTNTNYAFLYCNSTLCNCAICAVLFCSLATASSPAFFQIYPLPY